MSEKVYCEKCRYLVINDKERKNGKKYKCLAPNNKASKNRWNPTWLSRGEETITYRKPFCVNKNNDCQWVANK